VDLVGTPPIERRIVAVRRLDDEHRSEAAAAFWALLLDFEDPRGGPPSPPGSVAAPGAN
jgi:hypothetical protein